jgi:adenosylcobinamide-phosphate synthase
VSARRQRWRVLAVALALDALWGELPPRLHPVVGMGKLLDILEPRAPTSERARLLFGASVAVGMPLLWATVALGVARWVPWLGQALLLKPTFAGRALLDAAHEVERDLDAQRLPEARHKLRALVSRPTAGLDAGLASAAAIESLAENYVDSWLAPLVMYALGGLPLAYAYRAANTADAVWGYRDARHESLGKGAARLDDAFNFLPARAGALLLALVAPRPRRAFAVWRSDNCRTASPNAGQVMAAAAGALDVRLEKRDHYVLHSGGANPCNTDIRRARGLVGRAMCLAAALCLVGTA